MHGRLRAVLSTGGLGLALCLSGCVHTYQQPSVTDPHALAKVRVSYHGTPNTMLTEDFRLNDRELPWPKERGHLEVTATQALRVRDEPSTWEFSSTFWHSISVTEVRPEQVAEQYPCGTATMGGGSGAASQTTYCTRYHTEFRSVTVNQTVIDASCLAQLQQLPRDGAMYLIQYDVYDGQRCTLVCYEQRARADGGFDLGPCR